jgi:hypothetical protein
MLYEALSDEQRSALKTAQKLESRFDRDGLNEFFEQNLSNATAIRSDAKIKFGSEYFVGGGGGGGEMIV